MALRLFLNSPRLLASTALRRFCTVQGDMANRSDALSEQRARLMYQSRKRGMLENDLLLSTFAGKYLYTFNESQLNQYDRMINDPPSDWDLFYWAIGEAEIPKEFQNEVMDLFVQHVHNDKKEVRIRQPDLFPTN